MARGFKVPNRTVLKIAGGDAESFLQGLVTNDVAAAKSGLVYAALLSPQGKYLSDFFLFPLDDGFGLDVQSASADALNKRLSLYRLRADVTIEPTDNGVWQVWDDAAGWRDPRNEALGSRVYGERPEGLTEMDPAEWDKIRISAGVPETGIELLPDETYILEAGFERLSGVDFKKGCYVGQEVTARMKHKTELRKGLAVVGVSGDAKAGTPLLTATGKDAGTLFSVVDGRGLAHLRFDRATATLKAGDADVDLISPVSEL